MTGQTDVSRLIEHWLADAEPDVLPERVLSTVADRLPREGQAHAPFGLLATWRYAAVVASLAVMAAASLVAYGAFQPRPPVSGSFSPSPSGSPTMSPFATPVLTPFPSYSIPPAKGAGGASDRITGRVEDTIGGARVGVDLRGWHWPPSPSAFALMRYLNGLEGTSMGLLALVAPPRVYPRVLPEDLTAMLQPTKGARPSATIRIAVVDTAPDGLTGLAERVAADDYDGGGQVIDRLLLPSGPAALVRTRTTINGIGGGTYEVAIYLIEAGARMVSVTFAAGAADFDALQPKFRQIVEGITVD
jgi:hypothetical protein